MARACIAARTMLVVVLAACARHERSATVDAALTADAGATDADADARATSAAVLEPAPPPPSAATASSPRARAPMLPPAEWVWKAYSGDGFSALFPGDPRLLVLPAEDDKLGYTEARLDVPGGQVSFSVGFTDYAQALGGRKASEVEKPDVFLDEHASASRRGTTEVLHKRAIVLSGKHPGRVLIMRRNISGTALKVYSRLYLVGRRLYSLIVSTLDVGGVSEDAVKKFMESFKLL